VQDQEYSLVALDAYVKAARVMSVVDPPCRIRWSLIAGIARTESRHGTYGGSSLDGDGNETKPILGIALDGAPGTASVGDSDGGLLDGDPNSDRAVGPMQFIPSTWKRWGRDGNGDGKVDPQNMYDAALGAAAYLCYFGPGLDTDAGIRGAVIHYNNDDAYVELVLTRAKSYDTYTFGRDASGSSGGTAAPASTTSTTSRPGG
jgi:membrane-bound lytic murein transglycosylase B